MQIKLSTFACPALLAGALCLAPLLTIPALSAPPAGAGASAKKTYPAQSTVASKAVFATVAATSPVVKKALDAKDIAGAQKLIGKPASFQGTVSKVFSPDTNGIVILDFDPEFRSAVTAVAMPEAYAKLPDLQALEGKHVLVTGKFVVFKGAPQIVLTLPAQVKIIH